MKSQTDISHYCHANPVRLMDLNGMFDTEDEVTWFSFHNDINGSTTQRQDGSYELYDPNTRFTYYHDEDGMLHTDIPEVKVECQRISKYEDSNIFETVAHTLAKSDDVFNDVARPVIQGVVLYNPLLGTFNSGYTIKDIYGNQASTTDYMVSSADILTLGMCRFSCLKEMVKNMIDMTSFLCSTYSVVNTMELEYGKNDK